jgi:ABC-type nitrate/sulfonate/bicarbonate transport system substrate-binding protein
MLWAAVATAAVMATTPAAWALDKVDVGKAVVTSFAFATLEVGQQAGIWKQEGLDVVIHAFRGDAQVQQALTAGSIQFGLGSGPGMGFMAKGVPAKAVAAFAGPPGNMALLVGKNSGIKTIDDLTGKKIGVTTAGSLTNWLVQELSRQKHWTGAKAIHPVPLGAMRTRLAAMKTGEIQGTVNDSAAAYDVEANGGGKVLFIFGDLVKHFYTHVVFASNTMIDSKPELVTRFLRGLFKTVARMKQDKALAVRVGAEVMKVRPAVVAKTYKATMDMLSDDGHWDKQSIDVIRRSLVELKILPKEPDPKVMYTDKFVPVRF